MEQTKRGNGMMITVIIVAVVAVGIIGYLIYDNNQKQAEADAQIAAAQQQAAQAEAQKTAQAEAVKTEVANAQATAQANAAANAAASCEENLANAQKNLPLLEDYVKTLEQGAELIKENPDEAIAKCRETHESLSKPECETKIEKFIDGKTEAYDEAKVEITAAEELIAAGC